MTNEEPKYTSGYWKIMRHVSTGIESEGGRFVATTGSYSDGSFKAVLENEANDKLISAAPDLLQALQNLVEQFKRIDKLYSKDHELISQAEQAIQKALTL